MLNLHYIINPSNNSTMDDFKRFFYQYSPAIFIPLAVFLFILAAFCPIMDVLGKDQANGLKIIFSGDGLGFCRFAATMMVLFPIGTAILSIIKPHNNGALAPLIGFALCLISAIAYIMALPDMVTIKWGAGFYMFFAFIGIALNSILLISKA